MARPRFPRPIPRVSWPTAVVVVSIVAGSVLLAYSPAFRASRPVGSPPGLDEMTGGAGQPGVTTATVTKGTIRSVVTLDGVVVAQPTGRFEGVASVPPELLYRFSEPPRSVTVLLEQGPGPLDCPVLSFGASLDEASDPLSAPVRVRCQLPGSVRAFSGARLKMGVLTGEARDVLVLPVTAVAGRADEGYVTLVEGGQRVRRDVQLGLTDGLNIEIKRGLAEGDRVVVPPDDPLGLLGDGP